LRAELERWRGGVLKLVLEEVDRRGPGDGGLSRFAKRCIEDQAIVDLLIEYEASLKH